MQVQSWRAYYIAERDRHCPDIGQVPVPSLVVQPVTHHKAIVDFETDVIDGDGCFPPRRLAEQTRRAKASRVARAQNVLQVGEGESGVDDVFDDEDVAAVEGN